MESKKIIKVSTLLFFILLLVFLFWIINEKKEVLAQAVCADKLDLVFVMDTSGSMSDEFATLCGNISTIVADARAAGIDLKYKILGAGNTTRECATQSVVNYVNSVGGVPVSNNLEDWAPGTQDISNYFEWRERATRVIVPMSDEGAENGDPWDAADTTAINNAIAAAQANNVAVYPVIGTCWTPAYCDGVPPDQVLDGATNLASGTGGTMYRSTTPGALKDAIIRIIWSAWDADGDGYVTLACPCDPDNLPTWALGCFDCDDTRFDATAAEAWDCFTGGLVPCGRKVDDPTTGIDESAPCTLCHLFVLIKRVVDFLIEIVAFPILVFIIIIGGVLLLTAGGSESRIRQGKDIIRTAIIAMIILLCAWLIIDTAIVFLTPASSPLQSWHTITCPVP